MTDHSPFTVEPFLRSNLLIFGFSRSRSSRHEVFARKEIFLDVVVTPHPLRLPFLLCTPYLKEQGY